MVGTALTIEREIEDAWSIRIRVLVSRGRINLLLVRGRGRRLLLHKSFRTWACETGLPLETGIPGLWDSAVLVSCRTGEYTVRSSTP